MNAKDVRLGLTMQSWATATDGQASDGMMIIGFHASVKTQREVPVGSRAVLDAWLNNS